MKMLPKLPWTKEEDERLTKLWNENKLSTAEIGNELGRRRNGVIGRAHRLGLDLKASGGSRPGRDRKAVPKTPKAPKPPAPPKSPKRPGKPFVFKPSTEVARKPPQHVAPIQKWTGEGVPMLEATPGQCKAVMGSSDDARGLAVYCGKPVKEGTTLSFCSDHYAKYTTSNYWSR